MLRFDLEIDDLRNPVRRSGGVFLIGKGCLRPYQHRLLTCGAFNSPTRSAVFVKERVRKSIVAFGDDVLSVDEAEFDDRIGAVRRSSLDFTLVQWDRGSQILEVNTSLWATVPLYFRCRARVQCSWDPADLLDETLGIDLTYVAPLLACSLRYSSQTVVRTVKRLPAGSTARYSAQGLEIVLPPEETSLVACDVDDDFDAIDLFIDALDAVLEMRPTERARTAVEISGGIDSALTSLATARTHGSGVLSYAVIFAEEMGAAQAERRRVVVEAGKFRDIEVPASSLLPFSETSMRRTPRAVWPDDENYPEMFEPVIAMCAAAGIDALVTGTGGDELCPLYRSERPLPPPMPGLRPFQTARAAHIAKAFRPQAFPFAGLVESVWNGNLGRARRLLRFGIWPILPFSSTALARFTFRLPYALRKDRTLQRRALTRLLGSNVFEQDYVKETFAHALLAGLGENWEYVRAVLRNARSVELGLIDKNALSAALERTPDELSKDEVNVLFYLLNFELFVRDQKFDEQALVLVA